jgi:hypothetical protein
MNLVSLAQCEERLPLYTTNLSWCSPFMMRKHCWLCERVGGGETRRKQTLHKTHPVSRLQGSRLRKPVRGVQKGEVSRRGPAADRTNSEHSSPK